MNQLPTEAAISQRRRAASHALLALILLTSFALKLRHLDHPAIKPLDEVFHAIVARNFLNHPLTPTLIDRSFLPYDATDWQSTHIWLHKPPMALWQIAISFALLGMNTFALRLPSVFFSTGAVWLTYGIGCELLDRTAGLVAAALQAFNPVILMLINGYVFSDHVDISLLFYTELAIWFLVRGLRTGRTSDWIFCGIAQGLAFLSKTYPALIVSGLAIVAWAFPLLQISKPLTRRMRGRAVLLILVTTAVVVLPWMISIAIRFPHEFRAENLMILHHLNQDVEGWAGPWDRVMFDYWISIFYVFYPLALAALLMLLAVAIRSKELRLWMVLAWALGVLIPHLLATSKTMSATLPGWPAVWLAVGWLISRAIVGETWALATWAVAMLLAVCTLNAESIPRGGTGFGPSVGSVMLQHLWVLWHVLIAITAGGILWMARPRINRRIAIAIITMAMLATAWLMIAPASRSRPRGYLEEAWAVTQINQQKPAFVSLGAYLAKLPANAAMVVDEQSKLERFLIMFPADRTCYPLGENGWEQVAAALVHTGALPFFISPAPAPLPVVYADPQSRRIVYACTPAALAAGTQAAQEMKAK